jgi:uncharacterized protein YeaO (DUF488 family)
LASWLKQREGQDRSVAKRNCAKRFIKKMVRTWWGEWDEFKRKYFQELDKKSDSDIVDRIIRLANEENSITLLYGTKEERFNNAVALKEYLEEKIKK